MLGFLKAAIGVAALFLGVQVGRDLAHYVQAKTSAQQTTTTS